MLRIFQITDCHLYAEKEAQLNGAPCHENFTRIFNHVLENKNEEDYLLFGGDLTNDDSAQSYMHIVDRLKESNEKALFTPGNHDVVDVFNEVFKSHSHHMAPATFKQNNTIVVLLDSVVPGEIWGELDQGQLQMVKTANDQAVSENCEVILFLHHHVEPTKGHVDRYILKNYLEVQEFFGSLEHVNTVICGHVHQETDTEVLGVRYLSTPATCYQIRPGEENFVVDTLGPGYRIIEVKKGAVSTKVVRL